jgi:hypothetical protein
LKWLDNWNRGKPYDEQIRPFAFLLAFTPLQGASAPFVETVINQTHRGRPRRSAALHPIAPFDRSPRRALSKVFDRVTGKPIDPEQLKTYAQALEQYHVSPEHKFENGEHLNRGRTERRHVVAIRYSWIGKEANRIDVSGQQDPIVCPVTCFRLER